MQLQRQARRAVSNIAKLMVNRAEFVDESAFLQRHNYVYKTWASRDDTLLAKWNLRPGARPTVPDVILDRVVAVPTDDAGDVQAAGPGDATAAGQAEQEDAEFQAARQSRCIWAFHPDGIPLDPCARAAMDVASLEAQLKDLDEAAQRSVAAEVESAVEGVPACWTRSGAPACWTFARPSARPPRGSPARTGSTSCKQPSSAPPTGSRLG